MFACIVFLSLLVTVYAVSRPPRIYNQPDDNVYYKAGEIVELPCEADGEPKPSFEWTRNDITYSPKDEDELIDRVLQAGTLVFYSPEDKDAGIYQCFAKNDFVRYDWNRNEIVFNPSGNDDRIVQLPDAGTLVINMPEDKDEGIFQCFAKNDFGKSASKKVNLRQAKLASFAFAKPTYHTPSLGRPYTLPCVPPESVPPPSVFWITKTAQGGFNVVNYDSRVSMDREYRLRITNVKREDMNSGNPYACMAMNNIMRSYSQGPLHYITPTGVTEDFMKVEYLWADQDDRFGLLGSNFSVKCIFSGNPTPDVHWERTDNKTMSDRVNTKSFAQELQITNLQFEDAGTYECWATNSVSQDRKYRTFNIRVNARPYFLEEPKDIEVGVGADVMFTCLAGGVPEPSIEWFVNGESLKDVRDPRITGPRFKHPVETKIFLEKVEQTDHMVFQCNASNIHGYVFADVYLNVLSEAPTIITPPEPETETAEGQKVTLVCETTGKPDPIITWFKDDVLITGGRYRILSTGSLVIRAVVFVDAGHYKCQAENRYNVTDASGTLVVRRKTRIEQYPFDLEVYAQSEAKFTCSGTTDPEEVENLKILWQKDGKPITAYDQRMTMNRQDNSLTITGTIVRDSGTYTCIATNGLDNHTASATLLVKDKPEPPTNVRWIFCNKNATILWMPGSYNYAPIQYYVLQYNTSFNPDQWTFGLKVNASLSQVNMTLSPHVNYTFRLIAYNKIGASDPSAPTPTVCATKPDRPYSHPQNLRTLGHQYGKLYIEWTPVPQIMQNGPGFYYVLQILRLGAQAETQIESRPIDDWRSSHYEMNSAMIYEPYRITIKAINSVGEASADPPTIIGYSYEAQPTVTPTNFVVEEEGDTYAIFSWEFDKSEANKTQSRIRGEFRGFQIILWEQNQKALTVREQDIGPDVAKNATGNTFTARVENMVPNSKMEAQIAVLNNYFIGVPTETVKFTTQPGFPGSVDYLRITRIGATNVDLKWEKTFENRGNIEGYDISYRIVKDLSLGVILDKDPQIDDPNVTQSYLDGLLPNTKYRVYVYARTAKGRGEEYFIEFVTAAYPFRPDPPRNISWTSCDQNATVSWTPGSENNSSMQYFIIQYQTSLNASDDWTFGVKVNGSFQQANMTLFPNMNYTLRVVAYNALGASDPSAPSSEECSTKEDRPVSHPRDLKTLGNKFGSLYIEWTPVPVSMHGGRGFYYKLDITPLNQSESVNETAIVTDWTRHYYSVKVQNIYAPYRITIKSFNSHGECTSQPPTIIGYSFEAKPVITPTNVVIENVGKTFVILSWSFDIQEIRNNNSKLRGEFKGFKIIVRRHDNEDVLLEHLTGPDILSKVSGNTFTALVEGLPEITLLTAGVAVLNTYYQSDSSSLVNFTTGYEALQIITSPARYMNATSGKQVSMMCKTTGKPKAQITWYKDYVHITGGQYSVLSDGSLVIQSAVLTDSGHYICRANTTYEVKLAGTHLFVLN